LSQPVTLREKQRWLVKREIAAAAMRLFDAEGFDAVTVDKIAAAVGISSRTFFRYYETKEDLLLQHHRRIQERLVEALAARPASEGPVTALKAAYLATSRVAPEDREDVLLSNRFLANSRALRVRLDGEMTADRAPIVKNLAERMGVAPDDARAETLAVAMGAAAGAAFQRWLTSGGEGDPAEQIDAALNLLERGLAHLDMGTGRR
jgi:AcrR family transcriptional regulator